MRLNSSVILTRRHQKSDTQNQTVTQTQSHREQSLALAPVWFSKWHLRCVWRGADEKARVCPASHLSIPRMDVRRKREGGKRRVIVRRGGKEEAEKESKRRKQSGATEQEEGNGRGGGKRGDIRRTMSPSVSRAFKECPLCAVT